MALFKKKNGSIQQKIDALKRKQMVEESPEIGYSPSLPPVIHEASPEERTYLESLEKSLQDGKSILSSPGKQRRSILSVGMAAVPLEEKEIEPEPPDPFTATEREIEMLVEKGQQELEKRLRENGIHEVQAEPLPPEPLQMTPAAVKEIPSPPPVVSQATERQSQVDTSYDELGNLPFPPGTIVRLNDDSLGIIKEEIANREYDLVYILTAEGKVEPRGVCLFACGIERLGRLPKDELKKIEKKMAWSRDHLIYYLDDVKLTGKIPHPSDAKSHSNAQATRFDDGKSMQRGRTLSVVFGNKKWEAVFWGEDKMGAIVAHNQQGEWELLHMDLKRFGSSLQTGKLLQGTDLKEIEEAVIAKHTNHDG